MEGQMDMVDLKRYHRIGRIPKGVSAIVGFSYSGNVYASPGVLKHIRKRHSKQLSKKILCNLESTIKDIIQSPHFVGVNVSSKGISLELIKKIDLPILLALDIDKKQNYIYVASMYPISSSKVENRIHNGKLMKIKF